MNTCKGPLLPDDTPPLRGEGGEWASIDEAFLARAREEADRYGDDPWVFLRELAQNSRDAGASCIEVRTAQHASRECVIWEDDGVGMNRTVVRDYLLRLYASTKADGEAVGFFGVGFWSLLRFQPRVILVEARRENENVGVEIDLSRREVREREASLAHEGTRITAVRDQDEGLGSSDDLVSLVRERVIHYAGYLRRLDGERLEVRVNGERVDRPFSSPPFGARRIVGRGFEGIVGFGRAPSVKVFAAGLLVGEVESLEELAPHLGLASPGWERGWYPVVLLDIPGLRVLFDRRSFFEDATFTRAVRRCERELGRSFRSLSSGILPLDLPNLWWRVWVDARRPLLWSVVALGAVMGMWWGVHGGPPATLPEPAGRGRGGLGIEAVEETIFRVGDSEQEPIPASWDFHYEGPARVFFVARLLTRFDPHRGFWADPLEKTGPDADLPDSGPAISVRMRVGDPGRLLALPLPHGYGVRRGSVRLDEEALEVWRGPSGEALVSVPSPGWVSYEAVPAEPAEPCGHLAPETFPWPHPFRELLDRAATSPHGVDSLLWAVRTMFRYAQTPIPNDGWLPHVLTSREGDCDVLNGVAAALLRGMGVEAHLAVGLLGRGGAVEGPMHAVVRYCADVWHLADVTEGMAVAAPSPSPVTEGQTSTGPVRWRPVSLGAGVLVLVLAAGIVEWRARRSRVDADLVDFLLGHECDLPPSLRFRPLVPIVGGHRRSIFQLKRLAQKRSLVGASPDSPIVAKVRGGPVIDRSSPVVRSLQYHLPPIVWLDDPPWEEPSSPWVRGLERLMRAVHEGFRVHMVPGGLIRFVEVRFRDGGRYHVLLGKDHPFAQTMREAGEGLEGVAKATAVLCRYLPSLEPWLAPCLASLDAAGGPRGATGPTC